MGDLNSNCLHPNNSDGLRWPPTLHGFLVYDICLSICVAGMSGHWRPTDATGTPQDLVGHTSMEFSDRESRLRAGPRSVGVEEWRSGEAETVPCGAELDTVPPLALDTVFCTVFGGV